MRIALDYDGTITADHAFWLAFYHLARACGHEVFVVTMRHESERIGDWPGLVYYTARQAKKPWCEREGLQIHVWIDDMPELLLNNGTLPLPDGVT